MGIRVLHHFSGKESQERTIAPGDYLTDDAALFGLAEYLVTNGHAVEVASSASSDVAPSESVVVGSDPDPNEGRLHLENVIEELSKTKVKRKR